MSNFARKLDYFLDRVYGYNGPIKSPKGIRGQVWAMPKKALSYSWKSDTLNPSGVKLQPGEIYFLHYFQSQGYGPTPNECVTTSVLMSMNILQDWVAANLGYSSESNRRIEEYTNELDQIGFCSWRYRFSSNSLLPGMMHPLQAINALNDHANELREKFGKSYKVNLSSGHTMDELVQSLKDSNLILVHGARQEKISFRKFHHAITGGMAHTMVLVGYDGTQKEWIFLNPSNPMPASKTGTMVPKLFRMTTKQFMKFWGRRFIFYPPRFSITTITIEM